jgi:hypothetical protein
MRTLATLLFCLLFTGAFSQNLDSGLILYYPFNGNFHDTSVNQLHGIGNATLTQDPYGKPNSAIHFNGYDQYLDFPPVNPILKPDLPVSFAFWIKFEQHSPFVTLIFTTDYAQDKHTGTWVSTSWDGGLSCGYGDGTGNGPYSRRSINCNTILEAGSWYYVIAIIRGPEDISIYLDCVPETGTYGGSGGYLTYTDCQGSLGRKDSGVGYPPIYFQGSVDDFRYWGRALTPEEIDSLCINVGMVETPIPAAAGIMLYPNPTAGIINISNMPDEVSTIELIDSFGKILRAYSPVDQIPVAELSPGVYYLRFINDEKGIIARNKFIRE